MAYVIFDIETRVDKALLTRHFGDDLLTGFDLTQVGPTGERLPMVPDEIDDIVYREFLGRYSHGGRQAMPPLPCMIPICICLGSVSKTFELDGISALARPAMDEDDIARQFWERLESFRGTAVTFNGRTFDFPVMELRAMKLGIPIPRYCAEGRNRYKDRIHLDLFDWLTNFGACRYDQFRGGLDLLSSFVGGPPKDIHGSQVQELVDAEQWDRITAYCAADVLRTYLLFLRIAVMRGELASQEAISRATDANERFGS